MSETMAVFPADSSKKTSIILNILVTLLLLVGLWKGWRWIGEQYSAIRFVRLEGTIQHLDKNRIESSLSPLLNEGLLFIDFTKLQATLRSLPWVDHVEVERIWPDTLSLKLIEHTPAYRLGKEHLLSLKGKAFRPKDLSQFESLPVIYGPNGEEKRLFDVLNRMQAELKQRGLEAASFEVDAQKAWTLKLAGGMELQLGRRRALEMFYRFLASLEFLGQKRIAAIKRIDLRYRSGFAVGLKPNIVVQWGF